MTPPALLVLGTGTLVCALTASACVLGWPALLRQPEAPPPPRPPGFPPLSAADRARLLAMVPPGHSVVVQAVADPASRLFANAALDLLAEEGRVLDSLVVEVVRGIDGTGLTHVVERRRHAILVLRRPATAPDAA